MKKNEKNFSYKIESNEDENYRLNKFGIKKKIKNKTSGLSKLKNILIISKFKKQNLFQKFLYNSKIIVLIIILVILSSLIYLLIYHIIRKNKLFNSKKIPELIIKEINNNSQIIKEEKEELKKVLYFIENNINNNFITNFSENQKPPKISIIIPIYNDAKFLIFSLSSIQNQDFKDIEIIIVDDYSTDDSTEIINEFMKKDSRIVLLKNEEEKGILYTKTKGVLNSRGKYCMILENKDIYLQKDAFSTLYNEAEKDNLDILGFSAIINWENEDKIDYSVKGKYIHHFIESPIIFKPNITQRMYYNNIFGKIQRAGDTIFNYCFKTNLFVKIIMQIDDKVLKRKIFDMEDLFLFYLLTRNANNLKYIKRIFYFSIKNKMNQNTTLTCLDSLYYSEFLLNKTNKEVLDKKIASYELETWYLNTECRNKEYTRAEAINITKLFSENEFIEDEMKKKIYLFMFENVTIISN